jgi:glycosyltransferase involved in cell wall biosynthesis
MKLSIITVNLDNYKGLIKTLESVFNQTYKDFEYIVIDGGSTDGSLTILDDCSTKLNKNFYWISEPDTGVFNAMNKGIVRAKAEYLLFLNSGDFFIDNHVLKAVFSKEHETDIISCRCRVSNNGKHKFVTTPPTNYTFGFFYNNSLAHQATFIKRALFDKYGLYREDFKLMSDWEFFVRTIVIGAATTQNTDIVLTDYNMDGMSSAESNQDLIAKEKQLFFEDSSLKCFVPDYEYFFQNKQDKAIMEWAWSKRLFRLPILFIYQFIAITKKNLLPNESLQKNKKVI